MPFLDVVLEIVRIVAAASTVYEAEIVKFSHAARVWSMLAMFVNLTLILLI